MPPARDPAVGWPLRYHRERGAIAPHGKCRQRTHLPVGVLAEPLARFGTPPGLPRYRPAQASTAWSADSFPQPRPGAWDGSPVPERRALLACPASLGVREDVATTPRSWGSVVPPAVPGLPDCPWEYRTPNRRRVPTRHRSEEQER